MADPVAHTKLIPTMAPMEGPTTGPTIAHTSSHQKLPGMSYFRSKRCETLNCHVICKQHAETGIEEEQPIVFHSFCLSPQVDILSFIQVQTYRWGHVTYSSVSRSKKSEDMKLASLTKVLSKQQFSTVSIGQANRCDNPRKVVGEQLSIQGSEIIHEDVSGREAKVKHIIRSREYLLPAQNILYSEDDRVDFNLFDGEIISGVVEQCYYRGIDDASWTGSVFAGSTSDDSTGYFSLTCLKNSCIGHINLWTTGEEYVIKPGIRNGAVSLMKVNKQFMRASKPVYPTDELQQQQLPHKSKMDTNLRGAAAAVASVAMDTDLILDICMLYTNEALADFSGSVSAITAAIYNGNDQANTILQNSAISLRYRIVCVKKVSDTFSENGEEINVLLDQLSEPNDGYLDEAQTYRDTYGADFVGLVVSDVSARNHCAVAWGNTIFNDSFSYAAYGSRCVSSGRVYGHEIGHSMLCDHDRITAPNPDPDFIAYGNCWEDASKTDCTCYKSIMVYECKTSQHHCTNCQNKPYMANPNVIDSGNPTGL
eukprot:gene35151-45504_t